MKVLLGVGQAAIALLFLATGLFVTIGMVWMYYLFGFSQDGVKTTGTVVGIITWTESGETFHSPDVQFTIEDGQQVTVNMWCPPFGCFTRSSTGTQVPVIYQRSHPQRAIADTFAGRWVTPLLMLIIGLGITAAAAIGLADAGQKIRVGMHWERGVSYIGKR